ncbi:uncharacterized protein At4g04775-like [Lotus japonicus]|uniref:uncharacterized protein At4g04775-like n=1 Tax=Lotus japonicus TaxID=34305 RepID=UPI00258EA332|nr:uncharacterized protein At4g04775-like [Lotus japonicus]XP_057425782.1 uncharacterized protein At4g04775-like [Lotus japonicus]XP_057429135.1 uncharacterized protein At4g04775-like [Lotus japonicus]XP_057444491.1 uncharacterized protein At4g04775-like [Lotus japonicus]XP_057451843.1 uncharacterized protein At4g04775-like [Lotus japonicus]XP_057454711.1 uncharacterized protein At4g04775-like [Lotus japonicus]
MRRPTTSSTSATGSRASSLNALPPGGTCECGELILHLTSHTPKNPGRRFWRCRNFETSKDCGFFLWDDFVQGQGAERQPDLELLKIMHELEDLKRKHDELSRKLEESKKKNNKLQRKLDCETMKNNVAFFSVGFAVLLWVVGLGLFFTSGKFK